MISSVVRQFLALGFGAYLLAACGDGSQPAGDAGPSASGGEIVLHRGNAAEPGTLDPHQAQGNWEDNIIGDMLVGLTTQDPEGRPIPGAAERWETAEDGLTWTFHLRDHTWSDGELVTAEDFVYAWRRILDPQTAASYAYFLYPIKNAQAVNSGEMPITALGVSAPNPKTLVVQLEHPAPYFLEMAMHHTMLPVPRHVVESKGPSWVQAGSYVGNGAFTLVEWIPNDRVTLVKNPRFYDAENVRIDRVIFYPTSDYDAALRRFRAGELDVQDRLPPPQIDWLRANMPEVLGIVPQLTIEYFSINQSRKPFDDVRVREALNLAINRENITDVVRRLGEPPAYNMVPPRIANYPGGVFLYFKDIPYPERVARAQELMRAAGFGPNNRLRTTFSIRSTASDAERAKAAAVQQMLREIYVDIQIAPEDAAIFYSNLQEGNFDISNPAWGADFSDAANFLDLLRTNNSNNYGRYKNPEYDALLDNANSEPDGTKRGALLAQAEAIALKDSAWIPLHFWVTTNLVHTYVKGWVSNDSDKNRTRWLSIERDTASAQ